MASRDGLGGKRDRVADQEQGKECLEGAELCRVQGPCRDQGLCVGQKLTDPERDSHEQAATHQLLGVAGRVIGTHRASRMPP